MLTKKRYYIFWLDHIYYLRIDEITAYTAQEAYEYWCGQFETYTIPHNISRAFCDSVAMEIRAGKKSDRMKQRLKVFKRESTQQQFINVWFDDILYGITNIGETEMRVYVMESNRVRGSREKLFSCFLVVDKSLYLAQVCADAMPNAFQQWAREIQERDLVYLPPKREERAKKEIALQAALHQPTPLVHHDNIWHWYIGKGQLDIELYMVDTCQTVNPKDEVLTQTMEKEAWGM